MRIVVCGSRTWGDKDLLDQKMNELIPYTTITNHAPIIVHGGARGVDMLAGEWARGWGLTEEVHLPDYAKWGRTAPFVRNDVMLDSKPDRIIAFHANNSPGTGYMIKGAMKRKLDLVVVNG